MRSHAGDSYYTIGEVAKAVGVSAGTLRVWERQGLLEPARSRGGQRLYAEEHLQRAGQIAIFRRRHGWNPAAIRGSALPPVTAQAWGDVSLGTRIRAARRDRALTLHETARRVGVSRSFLSAVERGESGVSVRTLSRIADALQMPMSAFAPIHAPATSVVRRNDRPRTVLEGGVTWEELSAPGHALEPALLIVPPGATSGGPVTRAGETFVHVLDGALVFAFPDRDAEVTLGAGDSLTLAAASTWSWSNPGRQEARAVWVEQLPAGAWNGAHPPDRDVTAQPTAQPHVARP